MDAAEDHRTPHWCWLAKTVHRLSWLAQACSEFPPHLSCAAPQKIKLRTTQVSILTKIKQTENTVRRKSKKLVVSKSKGYNSLDRVEFVVDGGGRAGEMVDLVDLEEERLYDVVADELEPGVPKMVHHVFFPPREEVIHNDHTVPSLDQTVHKVRADEPGTASHHDPEPLPFQSKRNLPTRIPSLEPDPLLVQGPLGVVG